ncbi:TPA: hypothetical protein ACLGW6_005265, partial [Salmonella enterica]
LRLQVQSPGRPSMITAVSVRAKAAALKEMPEEGDIAVSWNGALRCRVRYRLPESKTAQPVVETEQECR